MIESDIVEQDVKNDRDPSQSEFDQKFIKKGCARKKEDS